MSVTVTLSDQEARMVVAALEACYIELEHYEGEDEDDRALAEAVVARIEAAPPAPAAVSDSSISGLAPFPAAAAARTPEP
jgi:hypothetical protein